MERFAQVIAQRHQYAQGWKERTGGKVVGYLCNYVPEEVLYAAGMLPVRILGSHQPQDVSDRHIFPMMWCAFCRDTLAQGLLGRYNYLDGLVHAWCCQHIRQTYDSWRRHVPLAFAYQFYIPISIHLPSARRLMVAEVASFKGAVEGWTGQAISPASLERAAQVYNTQRRLLRQVYGLRKREQPPLSGAEAMEMVLASMLMDREEHIGLLEESLARLAQAPEGAADGLPRLMLLGSENDDVALVRFLESLGARVVIDEQCMGSRYFWEEVRGDGDILSAIALRYIDRTPCPHKDVTSPHHRRLEHVLNLAKEYRVQGAVIIQQKFCDPYRYENPLLQSQLREQGIPSLLLEVELTLPGGQFRTRIEAFLETLLGAD